MGFRFSLSVSARHGGAKTSKLRVLSSLLAALSLPLISIWTCFHCKILWGGVERRMSELSRSPVCQCQEGRGLELMIKFEIDSVFSNQCLHRRAAVT